MDNATGAIEFTLQPNGGSRLSVRLRQSGERWAAEVVGDAIGFGIGTTARQALVAALEPLGAAAAKRLMADIGLLEPSRRVVEIDRLAAEIA